VSYAERRRAEILAARAKGETLSTVARSHGITRQRVHQIQREDAQGRKPTPQALRHIAACLRRAGMPRFAFTIDQAADLIEARKGFSENARSGGSD